jgi:rubrerythrin
VTTNLQGIDFSQLSLRDALDLAILIEEEAKERYEELAVQLEQHRTPEAAKFFRFMVENEAKHREDLLERRHVLYGREPSTVTRGMIFDIEAPDYDEARAFMSVREALMVALRAEQKAHAFFVGALPHAVDPAVRALFDSLREEELEHQQLVQAQLDKLPPDPVGKPEDYVDEPVEQ